MLNNWKLKKGYKNIAKNSLKKIKYLKINISFKHDL